MKIADIFRSLDTPEGDASSLTAELIPNAEMSRIAKDSEGQPALLFALAPDPQALRLRSYRLKYLEVIHNVKCTITESGISSTHIFTLARFTSKSDLMQEYFLEYADSLVKIIEDNPTLESFSESIGMLVRIFSTLSAPPAKSIQGLWAELFVICRSQDPAVLLNFWHARPEQKFDFDAGAEKLEIKSSTSLERAHYFSSDQLNPSVGSKILIASIAVQQASGDDGYSIQQMMDSISVKLHGNFELISKLSFIVAKTLGSALEESIDMRLSYTTASQSLNFYRSEDIPKILDSQIPKDVSEVRFRSSLKYATPADLSVLPDKGRLWAAL